MRTSELVECLPEIRRNGYAIGDEEHCRE